MASLRSTFAHVRQLRTRDFRAPLGQGVRIVCLVVPALTVLPLMSGFGGDLTAFAVAACITVVFLLFATLGYVPGWMMAAGFVVLAVFMRIMASVSAMLAVVALWLAFNVHMTGTVAVAAGVLAAAGVLTLFVLRHDLIRCRRAAVWLVGSMWVAGCMFQTAGSIHVTWNAAWYLFLITYLMAVAAWKQQNAPESSGTAATGA